jgi:hypothetical protein
MVLPSGLEGKERCAAGLGAGYLLGKRPRNDRIFSSGAQKTCNKYARSTWQLRPSRACATSPLCYPFKRTKLCQCVHTLTTWDIIPLAVGVLTDQTRDVLSRHFPSRRRQPWTRGSAMRGRTPSPAARRGRRWKCPWEAGSRSGRRRCSWRSRSRTRTASPCSRGRSGTPRPPWHLQQAPAPWWWWWRTSTCRRR